ncbi:cation:proton antiporter, partial [Nostoc sp. NIES-2111]
SIIAGEQGVIGHGRLLASIAVDCAGGAILGIAAGMVARVAVGEGKETNVAVIVSLALALASYRIATALGVSGPIAVVAAGLALSHWRRDSTGRDAWRARMRLFWSLVDDVVNTLLFLLMGVQILDMQLADFLMPAVLAAIPLALLARLVSVALPVAVLPLGLKDRRRATAALTWLGLRGAVSVALVLSIPPSPHRDVLTAACYAVVLFTIVVQGLLTPAVIGRLYGTGGGR